MIIDALHEVNKLEWSVMLANSEKEHDGLRMSEYRAFKHHCACLKVFKVNVVTQLLTFPRFAFDLSVWMFGVMYDASDIIT